MNVEGLKTVDERTPENSAKRVREGSIDEIRHIPYNKHKVQ